MSITRDWQPHSIPPAIDEDDEPQNDATFEPWISPKKQEMFLPLTGFAWYYHEEIEIVNHPAFQRLANINQLGQAYYVYRGATHKRIEHCLGVVAVAQKIISAIKKNAGNQQLALKTPAVAQLSKFEERIVRLAALLHDIGHLAAGHTLEDELGLIGLHDGDARLSLIFEKSDWPDYEFEEQACEPLGAKIDRLYAEWVPAALSDQGITASDLVRLLVRKPPKVDDPYGRKLSALKASADIRFDVCANIVGNTICADLLDYLYRDWYHVGRARSLNDRIFQYMEIRGPDHYSDTWHDKRSSGDSFVISLGRSPRIRTDGISAILGLLEARYELAEAVLFHRTKLAAGAMLDRSLFELFEGESPEYIVDKLLHLSDEELVDYCITEAKDRLKKRRDERYKTALTVLSRLKGRRLYSTLLTLGYNDFADGDRDFIMSLFSGGGISKKQSAENRTVVARYLEDDFQLPAGSIALYCVEVKPKIAEVMIAVDDRMGPFDRLEASPKHKDWLAGGHLSAQVNRFNRLMKLHFFISREARLGMDEGRLSQLRSFVKGVVVARGNELWQDVHAKASAIYMTEYHGKNVVSFEKDGTAGDGRYPNGAPKLRNFLRDEARLNS